MTPATRRRLLRVNAAFLGLAAAIALPQDIMASLYGRGPLGRVLSGTPAVAIGFVEAHGLALLLAIVLWRARPAAGSHLLALAIEVLLGASNLAFWQLFVAADALTLGYVTTALHVTFAAAQAVALLMRDRAVTAYDLMSSRHL